MRRHSLMVCLASFLAACANSAPSGPSNPGRHAAGQWQSLTPEQIAPAFSGSAIPEPMGGRIRDTGEGETVIEVYLANASTAPGTNQLNVAMDWWSFWRRGNLQPSGTYEIDPAKRLELLSAYFPGEIQTGAAETRAAPGGAISLLPVNYPDGSACVLAWQLVGAADQRWQPAPSRIFKTMRVCAPTLELDELVRSFAAVDLYQIVNASGGTGSGACAYLAACSPVLTAGILSRAIGPPKRAEW